MLLWWSESAANMIASESQWFGNAFKEKRQTNEKQKSIENDRCVIGYFQWFNLCWYRLVHTYTQLARCTGRQSSEEEKVTKARSCVYMVQTFSWKIVSRYVCNAHHQSNKRSVVRWRIKEKAERRNNNVLHKEKDNHSIRGWWSRS